jgi:hypothetical protein
MGSKAADLTVDVGATAVLEIIDQMKKDDNGKFLDIHVPGWDSKGGPNEYKGGVMPW